MSAAAAMRLAQLQGEPESRLEIRENGLLPVARVRRLFQTPPDVLPIDTSWQFTPELVELRELVTAEPSPEARLIFDRFHVQRLARRTDGTTRELIATGVALARVRNIDGRMTVDAIVMATAAMLDPIVITGDVADLGFLTAYFAGVALLTT